MDVSSLSSLPALLRAELRRAVVELAQELRPRTDRRSSGVTGSAPATWTARLQDVGAAGGSGTRVDLRGQRVRVLVASHASARVEIAFDYGAGETDGTSPTGTSTTAADPTVARAWVPAVPGSSVQAPGGRSFTGFRVRRATGTPASSDLVHLGVDVDDGQAVEEAGRFAQVTTAGATETALKITRASDGQEAYAEGADGTAATRAAVGVAGFDGAVYRRLLTAAAALADGLTPGAGAILGGAFAYVYDATGAVWNRLLGGIGDPSAAVLRVVGATTPTSTSSQVTAGAASGALAAANANRRALVLHVPSTATAGVYVRANTAADATAFLVPPGATLTITDRRAINVLRAGAADVTCYVYEESHA